MPPGAVPGKGKVVPFRGQAELQAELQQDIAQALEAALARIPELLADRRHPVGQALEDHAAKLIRQKVGSRNAHVTVQVEAECILEEHGSLGCALLQAWVAIGAIMLYESRMCTRDGRAFHPAAV